VAEAKADEGDQAELGQYPGGVGQAHQRLLQLQKLHRISYALRPTFTDWRWDEPLAYELIGFHNAQTWGSRDDWAGTNLWEIDPQEDAAAAVSLEGGICPLHGKYENVPIHWGGLIPIRTVVEPYWESVGAGYWRWTGLGDRARDGPG